VIPSAIYAALLFTVVLLVTAAYFLMGGLPLLILKHDTPLDARFVHGFFNIYFLSTIGAATAASASYALSGRFAFAVGTALIASLAAVLRNRLMPAMAAAGGQIQSSDAQAVQRFRRLHVGALLVNVAQLVVLVWGLTRITL
jgi:hypothetical protein